MAYSFSRVLCVSFVCVFIGMCSITSSRPSAAAAAIDVRSSYSRLTMAALYLSFWQGTYTAQTHTDARHALTHNACSGASATSMLLHSNSLTFLPVCPFVCQSSGPSHSTVANVQRYVSAARRSRSPPTHSETLSAQRSMHATTAASARGHNTYVLCLSVC